MWSEVKLCWNLSDEVFEDDKNETLCYCTYNDIDMLKRSVIQKC